METKSYAKAVDDLDSVIKLNPRDAQGYYQRGLAYEQNGDFGKAIEDYKTALARNGKFGDARKALARATAAERQAKVAPKEVKPQVAKQDDKPPVTDKAAKPEQKAPQPSARHAASGIEA